MSRNNVIIISFVLFVAVFSFTKCVDPYHVNVDNDKSFLVVDALITSENKSHLVKLSRSRTNIDEENVMETSAFVSITGDNGENEVLKETEPGIYKTDSSKFVVRVGGKYKLSIVTSDGKHYESVECEILPPTVINNVYYKADKIIDGNNQEIEGIRFYADGSSVNNKYLRWICEEDWKFEAPFPQRVAFNEDKELYSIPIKNRFCYKKSESYEISIQALSDHASEQIVGKEVNFVPTNYTDKFQIKYSILIKQLSISAEEHEFWSRMKKVNEDGGDMFGVQPFSIPSNIVCVDDDSEVVLGYFQAGGVASKRLFITNQDVRELGLKPLYNNLCSIDTVMVDAYKLRTMYDLYIQYVLIDGYGLHDQAKDELGLPLEGLWLASERCTDCSLTGSVKKPLFWED